MCYNHGINLCERKCNKMADRLIYRWETNPGRRIVSVYEISGLIAALRVIFQPNRAVDVSCGVRPNFCKPNPIILNGNERVEVVHKGKIVMKG